MEKKVLIIIVLLIISTVLAIGLFYQSVTNENSMTEEIEKHGHAAEMAEGYYFCPMHPDVIAQEAGSCPMCDMDLVFVEGEHNHDEEGEYVCPMHPDVLETSPGNCPVCGMKLIEKEV